jgi:hypothetical protein
MCEHMQSHVIRAAGSDYVLVSLIGAFTRAIVARICHTRACCFAVCLCSQKDTKYIIICASVCTYSITCSISHITFTLSKTVICNALCPTFTYPCKVLNVCALHCIALYFMYARRYACVYARMLYSYNFEIKFTLPWLHVPCVYVRDVCA